MNGIKHPLVEKQLAKLPQNWKEWLERWNTEDDPLALLSLLHHGPEMPDSEKFECRYEAAILYLRLATRYYYREQQFGEESGPFDGTVNIFTCPRYTLGKTAFQTLCKYAFRKTESDRKPWEFFVWHEPLLKELVIFLGADSLEIGNGHDELHGLFCYARDRYKEILREFCLGLAEFLITTPFPTHAGDEDKAQWTPVWRSYRKFAVKILWYLERLDMLIEQKKMVDESILNPLKELILYRDIEVPMSTRSSKTVLRKPREVRDVLKIKADSYFWHHGGCQITKAAYIYLGLTAGNE